MPGPQRIYVDFTVRDPEGRFYVARVDQFSPKPELELAFIGTDFDEFEVSCEVLAIFHDEGVVLVRPLDAAAVPGTAVHPDTPAVMPTEVGVTGERATSELVLSR